MTPLLMLGSDGRRQARAPRHENGQRIQDPNQPSRGQPEVERTSLSTSRSLSELTASVGQFSGAQHQLLQHHAAGVAHTPLEHNSWFHVWQTRSVRPVPNRATLPIVASRARARVEVKAPSLIPRVASSRGTPERDCRWSRVQPARATWCTNQPDKTHTETDSAQSHETDDNSSTNRPHAGKLQGRQRTHNAPGRTEVIRHIPYIIRARFCVEHLTQ